MHVSPTYETNNQIQSLVIQIEWNEKPQQQKTAFVVK